MAKAKSAAVAAKKVKKVLSPEQKEAKKKAQIEKYETPVDKYVEINVTKDGKANVTTQAMHVRGMGCFVRTVSPQGVSEVFVPGMKIKTKKTWKTLVEDKPKKEK